MSPHPPDGSPCVPNQKLSPVQWPDRVIGYHGILNRALRNWGRSLNIDRRRPKAGPDDDELALLVAIVAFAVYSTLGDMDKISSYCRDDLRATSSRLQS